MASEKRTANLVRAPNDERKWDEYKELARRQRCGSENLMQSRNVDNHEGKSKLERDATEQKMVAEEANRA